MKNSYPIIDGERIFKATNVREIHPIYLQIAKSLSTIDMLPGFLMSLNMLFIKKYIIRLIK